MSTTALEIDAPQLSASQLIAHPGSLPTITIPVNGQSLPDAEETWRYLFEAAEFFALAMPGLGELSDAITAYAARGGTGLRAVSVTIAAADGTSQILVTGTPVRAVRGDAVRISVDDAAPHAHCATDPRWRRMAARTTSRGEVDQLERWLNVRGLADCVSDGVPHLGALVLDTEASGILAVENPEPTSVLDQLEQCGVITVTERKRACPRDVRRAWWISPRYEAHPVAELGGSALQVGDEGTWEATMPILRRTS